MRSHQYETEKMSIAANYFYKVLPIQWPTCLLGWNLLCSHVLSLFRNIPSVMMEKIPLYTHVEKHTASTLSTRWSTREISQRTLVHFYAKTWSCDHVGCGEWEQLCTFIFFFLFFDSWQCENKQHSSHFEYKVWVCLF